MRRLNPEGTASPGHTAHRRRFSEHTINTVVRNTSDADSTSNGILSDPDVSSTGASPISQRSIAARKLRGGRQNPSRGGATPRGIKSGIRGGVKGGTRKMYTARRRKSQIIHSSEGEEDEESNDSDAGEEEEDDKEVEAGTSISAEGSESRKGDGPEGGKAEEEEDEDDEDEEKKTMRRIRKRRRVRVGGLP